MSQKIAFLGREGGCYLIPEMRGVLTSGENRQVPHIAMKGWAVTLTCKSKPTLTKSGMATQHSGSEARG